MPTPAPTVTMSSVLPVSPPPGIMSFTWLASTVRSGSAMVIKSPIIKHTPISIHSFLDLVRPEPICSPMGVIARSAPRLKRAMPAMSTIAEIIKAAVSVAVRLTAGVSEIIMTMSVTGATEVTASFSFESRILCIMVCP